ncbi:MAG: type II and III secretion system protein family protein, partial [Planctomycetota bacterium]
TPAPEGAPASEAVGPGPDETPPLAQAPPTVAPPPPPASPPPAPPLPAAGGPPASPPPAEPLRVTVRQAPRQVQLISVPLNQGMLVDFSAPVRDVHVANAQIADVQPVSPRQILVTGRAFGSTQLLATVDGGAQQTFTVNVDLDLERLQAAIRTAAPRAKVRAEPLLDAIVLDGTVPDAESAERIMRIATVYSPQVINQMRVAGVYQVLLRCTVAEVNRAATRRLGFNGWMAGDDFKDMFAVSQIGGINPVNIGAAGGSLATATIPFATDENGLNLTATPTLSLGFPRVQMQIFIQALRENGLLKILAEPNLVTVSGQEASFLAGGEFPIPVPQGGTSNAITVEFREFGVRLRFTPTVLNDRLIRMHVAPEVSEPDFSTAVQIGGYAVPGLTQRRVETSVEMGPGQTFAIGGLLSEKARANSSKVPALGDIPVLGALFSSVSYQSAETELVILVTPELVAPLNPDQVAGVPGSGAQPPNDWELFGLGQLEAPVNAKSPDEQATAPTPESGAAPRDGTPSRGTAVRLPLRGPVGPADGAEGS